MKHIANDAYLNNSSTLVLRLSQEAKAKRAQGINVNDVTIGMLIDENNKLLTSKIIEDAFTENKKVDRGYPAISGGAEYNENVLRWIFRNNYSSIKKKYAVGSTATMGGTGALFLAFRNYIGKNNAIILPDLCWGNYISIANNLSYGHDNYLMFDGDKLNIKSIKQKVKSAANKYHRVTIVINDPAQNPTGYTINKTEWMELIEFFNSVNKKYPLTLILDIAYLDFAKKGRTYFSLIAKNQAHYLTLVCFSASKSFTMYGMRLGALVAISENKEDVDDMLLSASSVARSSWSCPNAVAVSAFNTILSNKNNFKLLDQFYASSLKLLAQRCSRAKKYFGPLVNGKLLPYIDGFFLIYKVDNANKVAEKLKEKNIYVLPLQDKYIRIALCSYTNKD